MAMEVKFDTGNAAFEGDWLRAECAQILRRIADKVEHGEGGEITEAVFDINGNMVGWWRLEDKANG